MWINPPAGPHLRQANHKPQGQQGDRTCLHKEGARKVGSDGVLHDRTRQRNQLQHGLLSEERNKYQALCKLTKRKLFPIPTLVDKLTFSLKEPDYFHNILLQKYRLRGYRAIQRLPTEQEDVASGNAFSTKSRRVGDELTWKVALSGIAPSQTPSAVEHVCFDICEGKESLEEWRWMVLKPVN